MLVELRARRSMPYIIEGASMPSFRSSRPIVSLRYIIIDNFGIPGPKRAVAQEEGGEWPLQAKVLAGVRHRLDLPFHGGGLDPAGCQRGFMSCESTANTFRCKWSRSLSGSCSPTGSIGCTRYRRETRARLTSAKYRTCKQECGSPLGRV